MNKTRFWALPLLFLLVIFLLPTNKAEALLDENNADPGEIGSETGEPTGPGGGSSSTQGTLNFYPSTVKDGGYFNISLTGAPSNVSTRLWVNNNDGKGYQNFGEWLKTSSYGTISASRTLNCNNYSTLDPTKYVPVGNRVLLQNVYLEYLGLNKTSSIGTHTKDCTTSTSINVNPPQENNPTTGILTNTCSGGNCNLFPRTVKEVLGRSWVDTPFPYHFSKQGEICTQFQEYLFGTWAGCHASQAGKAVYPYKAPVVDFIGRILEGGGYSLQQPWRTLNGPTVIKTSENQNRIYMLLGSTLVAYNGNTMFNRLTTEEPRYFYRINSFSGHGYVEAGLPWDYYFYPEKNDWVTYVMDGVKRMFDFDLDDRGYIYPATFWGWGIVRDTGSKIEPVMQAASTSWLLDEKYHTPFFIGSNKVIPNIEGGGSPVRDILSFKSGSEYYLYTGGNRTNCYLYNVTNTLNPKTVWVRSADACPYKSEKVPTSSGDMIAFLYSSNKVEIYSASRLVSGGSPENTFDSLYYRSLASDPNSGRFFSLAYEKDPSSYSYPQGTSHPIQLSVFYPTGNLPAYTESSSVVGYAAATRTTGITEKHFSLSGSGSNFGDSLSFNAGYLVATVAQPKYEDGSSGGSLRIWVFNNGEPKEVDFHNYFANHYGGNNGSYAIDVDYGGIDHGKIIRYGGKDYLIVSTSGQADVYEIDPQASDTPVYTDPSNPVTPTSTPTIPPTTTIEDWLAENGNKSCAEIFATKTYLIPLCEQLEQLQSRTCSILPSNPYCILRDQYAN